MKRRRALQIIHSLNNHPWTLLDETMAQCHSANFLVGCYGPFRVGEESPDYLDCAPWYLRKTMYNAFYQMKERIRKQPEDAVVPEWKEFHKLPELPPQGVPVLFVAVGTYSDGRRWTRYRPGHYNGSEFVDAIDHTKYWIHETNYGQVTHWAEVKHA